MWQSPWFHIFYILPSSSILFENKGVEFINIAGILCDSDIVKSLPSSSVKFPMPMVTYKLAPPISTKFFNFNKFANNLDLDLFLANPDNPNNV